MILAKINYCKLTLKMERLVLVLLAAFICGVTSDYACIFDTTKKIAIINFFTNPEKICQDVESKFDQIREELKNCTQHKISIDEMECVVNDFCTFDSEFRQSFNKSQPCLLKILDQTDSCWKNVVSSIARILQEESKTGKDKSEICINAYSHVLDCIVEKVREQCEDEAAELIKRMVESIKYVIIGACFDAAGVDADENDLMPPVAECLKIKDLTANSSNNLVALYSSIILGVYIALKLGKI